MKKRVNLSAINDFLADRLLKLRQISFKRLEKLQAYCKSNRYARLIRLDKPAGIMLLMLPCLWAIGFAARNWTEKLLYSLLFALGALIMRSAGCIINDICDRHLDKQVERTKTRPLAAGEVSLREALILLSVLLFIALLILLALPKLAIYIGISSVIPIALYPLMKRYTFYPQVFLGFVFNIGVIIAWVTISPKPSYSPILIYISAVLWTICYDTIYAFQDIKDDQEAGIKSLALKLGDNAVHAIRMMYQVSALSLFIVGLNTYMNWGFFILMALAAYHLYWQTETLDINDAKDMEYKFKSNVDFGLLVLLAVWIGKIKFS